MEASLRKHWQDFAALRRAYAQKTITVGIDSGFARKWILFRKPGCPITAKIIAYFLILLLPLFLTGAIYTGFNGESFLSILLFISVYLDWRFFRSLAAGYARSAALGDENLFDTWYKDQSISVRINKSGKIVWYDTSG